MRSNVQENDQARARGKVQGTTKRSRLEIQRQREVTYGHSFEMRFPDAMPLVNQTEEARPYSSGHGTYAYFLPGFADGGTRRDHAFGKTKKGSTFQRTTTLKEGRKRQSGLSSANDSH